MALSTTLLDVVKFTGMDSAQTLFDECMEDCPTFTGHDKVNNRSIPIAVEETDQEVVETYVRTGLPKISPFRNANEGVKPGKGDYEKRMVQLATSTSYWDGDKSLIDKNPVRGARYMDAEAEGLLRANFLALEQQFIYGTTKKNDEFLAYEKGFQGLANFCDPGMVTDAKGTGSELTSVWFVWWSKNGVSWIYGKEGEIKLTEPEITTVYDEKGGRFPAYQQYMEFYPGVVFRNTRACGRIANIDTSSVDGEAISASAFTDLTIRRHLAKFPTACRPNAIYMPAKVNLLLAASRSTVSISGQKGGAAILSAPALPPDNFDGIPIVYTDNILIGEEKWTAPKSKAA